MPYQPTNPSPYNVAINLNKEMQFSFKVDAYDVVEGFKIELYDYLKQKKLYTIIRTTGELVETQDENENTIFVLQEGNKQILKILDYDGTQLLLKEMDWVEEFEGNSFLPVNGGDDLVSIVKVNLFRYIAELNKYEQKIYYQDTKDVLNFTITNEECFEINEDGVIIAYYEQYNKNENGQIIPTVLIPYKLDYEGEEKKITGIAEGVFQNCQVERIVFPTTLSIIGDYAFQNCVNLHTIDFNNGNSSIGISAFQGCSNLSTINFVESISEIGSYAFADCQALNYIELPASEEFTDINEGVFSKTNLTSITLSNSIQKISAKAFAQCYNLFSINFNNNLQEIGEEAFLECDSLQKIKINEGVVSIGTWAFRGCSRLEEISFPTSLETINIINEDGNRQGILNECSNLEKLTIPFVGISKNDNNSDTSKLGALFGTTNENVPEFLETIILTNCTFIPTECFSNCKYLVNVELPDNLEIIHNKAFYNCVRLSGIDIPISVTEIGEFAFALEEQKKLND